MSNNYSQNGADVINSLSEKEKQFIKLVCDEFEPSEIATIMNVTIQTVYTYKKRILKKIDAKGDIGIAAFAVRNGLC